MQNDKTNLYIYADQNNKNRSDLLSSWSAKPTFLQWITSSRRMNNPFKNRKYIFSEAINRIISDKKYFKLSNISGH